MQPFELAPGSRGVKLSTPMYPTESPKRTAIQDLTQMGHDTLLETANVLRQVLARLRGDVPEGGCENAPAVDGSYLGVLHRHNDLIRDVHVMARELSEITSG